MTSRTEPMEVDLCVLKRMGRGGSTSLWDLTAGNTTVTVSESYVRKRGATDYDIRAGLFETGRCKFRRRV